MKKYLLFIISMLCVSIGTLAQASFSDDYKGAYITTNGEGNLTVTALEENASHFQWVNYVIVTGNVNNSDIANLASATYTIDGNSLGGTTIDFSGVTTVGNVTFTAKSAFKGIKLPTGYDLASYSGPQTFAFYVDGSNAYLKIIDADNGLEDIKNLSESSSWANAPVNGKTVYLSGNYGDFETAKAFLKNKAGATDVIKVVPVSNDPYTVDGCNVTINMAKAEGKTFAQVLSEAKAAMTAADATQKDICTLIVQGELTNADLAVLGDADVAKATRIDLSLATIASGSSIDNIQLPSTLTQLVLPKGKTVSSVLSAKLAAVTDLWYAYSPSSDSQLPSPNTESAFDETKNLIADYVWINKAGGLAQAFTNEGQLRNSYYIKVASNVALNETDVNFNALGDYKPTNYLFLDFSESNLTPEMATNYRVTDDIGYRIILPDNWTLANMAVFANLTVEQRGNMAAVYSYEGTKLKILEITDGTYSETALKNPRIVRQGTTAIEVLGELIDNGGGSYTQHGDFGTNLIKALNQADDDPDDAVNNIKSIIINVGQANTILTEIDFTNTNIENFSMAGVKNFNNVLTGPGVDVSGCTNLKTIDVSNATLQLLDAHGLTNLTSVNMNGTLMTNANGLSGETDLTGCTNLTTSGFTTNSNTTFKKDLKLINTGLTSFSTPATVEANIYLNASANLASVDLNSTKFVSGWSGKVHVDADATEADSNTDAIAALKKTTGEPATAIPTISVPNGFTPADHIHPYADVQNHIAEAAQSSTMEDDCNPKCSIAYDAETKVATVHVTTPGHLAELMKTNYSGIPEGTTFKFDNTSNINAADLEALAGNIPGNDMAYRSNYYYVDLYDLTATDALCNNTTGVINTALEWMRTNDRQFKGLILPKDHTQYGSGTTLIQDGSGTNTQLATCSEFIAYYKTKDEQGQDVAQKTFVGHVYNQSTTAADAYQASYEKMLSLVDAHTYTSGGNEVPEVKTDASIVLISSNSATKLNSSSTSISGATRIETINNEMVGTQTGKASIYAYPIAPGAFATASASTGLQSTPTELLQINGSITAADITAINGFTNGPRVLDLRYANTSGTTGISKTMLNNLTNTDIEYILLPEGQTKEVVCGADYSDLTNLKAVISSTSTNCVAYVKTAGSLAEARYLATGGSIVQGTSLFSPTKLGLTSVTLAGNLNAADLGCNLTTYGITDDGHWSNTSTAANASVGLSQESGITSIDLKDAVFVNKVEETTAGVTSFADMNFSWAGLANLSNIQLPTNGEMKLIPQNCCGGLASLKEICIPNNYTKIDNGAFLNTIVEHITTTDAQGALIDNGPNSYTLSANLQEIGSDPGEGQALAECVFPQNRPVYNCYILATKTPKCYKNAFPANMLYGWGGFDGTLPYCRDKYVNGTNYFCVLRFPSEQSYDAVTNSEKKDDSYELMQKQYTDVTKVYSKKEQTGAVDANGKEITWPTFSELRRAYNQATAGITWNKWVATYDSNQEVNGGDNIPTEATGLTLGDYTYDATDRPGNNNLGTYNFTGYEGWHQFTLSQATYVEPDEVIEQEKIVREYEDAGWFTFCIPYDMTIKQVREWLGVPKSEGNVISKYDGSEVTTDMMPEAHQLYTVVRHTSTGPGDNNSVTLRFTTDLINSQEGTGEYLTFSVSAEKDEISRTAVANNESYDNETRPVLKGGTPYLIKAYKRKGVTIKSRNLGDYIMKAHADEWKQERSCLRHGLKYREYLGTSTDTEETPLGTLHFAKPFEHHKIWAADDASTANYLKHGDGKKYYYAFVGQFWDQKLPKYCFYQGGQNWYRNTSDNNYVWQAYKCVIMAIPVNENDTHVSSGKYRDETNSNYPHIETGTDDKLDGTLKIAFSNGLDDNDFPGIGGAPKYIFTDMVTETILEYEDEKGNITSIDNLDGVDTTPKYKKIYNMSGQYMGTSTENLPKGMYIINGKKFVVQ